MTMEELREAVVEIALEAVEPELVADYRELFTKEIYLSNEGLIWSNDSATGIAIRFWNYNGKGYASVIGSADHHRAVIDGGLTPRFIADFSADNMV